jgi:hypothetical protein
MDMNRYRIVRAACRGVAIAPVLVALALVASWIAWPVPASAQTAEEIIGKVIAARGGLEKVKAIQSERLSGTIYFSPELYGPFIAEFKRPGKMHNEVTIQNKTVVRTFNGKDAGWIVNPFAGKDTPEPMTPEDIKAVLGEADFDGPLVDPKSKGISIEFEGADKIEGRDVYKLKVKHKDGQISSYAFDAKTFLLSKWTGTDSVAGQTVTRETVFHDYRDVDGLKFAFELVSSSPDTDVTQRIVVDKIELDPQIEESRFAKPATPAASPSAAPTAEPPGKH